MGEKESIFDSKAIDKVLMAAARAAYGYVYYETRLKRIQCKDGSWKARIDVYEKYKRPSRKSADILKEYGVETNMHRHLMSAK